MVSEYFATAGNQTPKRWIVVTLLLQGITDPKDNFQ